MFGRHLGGKGGGGVVIEIFFNFFCQDIDLSRKMSGKVIVIWCWSDATYGIRYALSARGGCVVLWWGDVLVLCCFVVL